MITFELMEERIATGEMIDAMMLASEATKDLGEALRESRARNRRRLHRIAVYGMIFLMAVSIWFLPIKWGWQLMIDFTLWYVAFLIYCFDNAKEMDHNIPLSPDEMIMQKELERRES